jgi:hypothetical protein
MLKTHVKKYRENTGKRKIYIENRDVDNLWRKRKATGDMGVGVLITTTYEMCTAWCCLLTTYRAEIVTI